MSSYRIPFVSLTGNHYEIRIYPAADGYDDTGAVTLKGASEPLVTEEESSTDVLLPVRSSTGYVNIETNDPELQEKLMPLSADEMRVSLMCTDIEYGETESQWEGYLRPETFSQDWSPGPWEIQLPVVSRLGMIMDSYLSSGNSGLLTVGQWLARICGDVYSVVAIPENEIMKEGTMSWGADTLNTPTALQLAFDENIFKSAVDLQDREDPTDTTSGMWEPGTNMDIATSICTAMRWVLCEHGDMLVIVDPSCDYSRYLLYYSNSIGSPGAQPFGWRDKESNDIYMFGLSGDDGRTEVLLPFGSISVNGATGKYDSRLIAPSNEDWMKVGGIPYVNGAPSSFNRPDTVPFTLYGDSSATIKSQKAYDNAELETFLYFSATTTVKRDTSSQTISAGDRLQALQGANEMSSMLYCNCFPYVVFGQSAASSSALMHGDYIGGGEVSAVHYFYERSGGSYVHYRMNSIVLGKIGTSDNLLRPAVRLKCSLAKMLPYSSRKRGYISLCLSGTVHRGRYYNSIDMPDNCDGDGFYGIQVSIRIGGYYLYKDTWGSHRCALSQNEVPFDVLWTKHDNNQFCEYIRLGMTEYFPMTLDAPVEITIYTPSNAYRTTGQALVNNCKYLRIDNFQVRLMEQEDDDDYDFSETLVAEQNSGISISERLGSNRLEEYSISTSFGAPDNPGALININEVVIAGARMSCMQARQIGKLSGGEGARTLCRRTYEWLRKQGLKNRHCLTVPLRRKTSFWPYWPGNFMYGGGLYFSAARSSHWRDDQHVITLIEIIQ